MYIGGHSEQPPLNWKSIVLMKNVFNKNAAVLKLKYFFLFGT